VTADYLRRQAATCTSWARECFDLETATRLRLMADEFRAKADEIEASARFEIEPDAPPSASTYKTGSHDH
jgi:hypothetical protein